MKIFSPSNPIMIYLFFLSDRRSHDVEGLKDANSGTPSPIEDNGARKKDGDVGGGDFPHSISSFENDQPTEEELATLRIVSDKIPWAAFLVAVIELCERFTYYGLSGPFQNYIQNPYKNKGVPGALGKFFLKEKKKKKTSLSLIISFFFLPSVNLSPLPSPPKAE